MTKISLKTNKKYEIWNHRNKEKISDDGGQNKGRGKGNDIKRTLMNISWKISINLIQIFREAIDNSSRWNNIKEVCSWCP